MCFNFYWGVTEQRRIVRKPVTANRGLKVFVLRSDLRGKVLRDNRELHLPRTKTAMG